MMLTLLLQRLLWHCESGHTSIRAPDITYINEVSLEKLSGP
jgi:hypothetical protein